MIANTKALKKDDLLAYGIKSIRQDPETKKWTVVREYQSRSGAIQTTQISQGKNHGFPSFSMSVNGKTKNLMVSRVVYAWMFRDIRDGEIVAFIDGDPQHIDLFNIVCVPEAVAQKMAERTPEQCAQDWKEHIEKFGSPSATRPD